MYILCDSWEASRKAFSHLLPPCTLPGANLKLGEEDDMSTEWSHCTGNRGLLTWGLPDINKVTDNIKQLSAVVDTSVMKEKILLNMKEEVLFIPLL